MLESRTYLCSELIQLTAGGSRQIANLEAIGAEGCTVFTNGTFPKHTRVRLQCLECPAGERNCTSCLIRGKILAAKATTPLGVELDVRFDGEPWSPERWKPRHLMDVQVSVAAQPAQDRATADGSPQQEQRPAV